MDFKTGKGHSLSYFQQRRGSIRPFVKIAATAVLAAGLAVAPPLFAQAPPPTQAPLVQGSVPRASRPHPPARSKPKKMRTVDRELLDACSLGDVQKVQDAIRRGANIDVGNVRYRLDGSIIQGHMYHGRTPLMTAVINGNPDLVKFLIKAGADVNRRQVFGRTALMYAARGGNREIVDLLIAAKAKPNARDKNGSTALMGAVQHQKEEAVRLLLERGARVDIRDSDNKSALTYANEIGNVGIATLLKQYGATE